MVQKCSLNNINEREREEEAFSPHVYHFHPLNFGCCSACLGRTREHNGNKQSVSQSALLPWSPRQKTRSWKLNNSCGPAIFNTTSANAYVRSPPSARSCWVQMRRVARRPSTLPSSVCSYFHLLIVIRPGAFTMSMPHDQEIGESHVARERLATDFEAPKLWKGRSGTVVVLLLGCHPEGKFGRQLLGIIINGVTLGQINRTLYQD